jgi:predicted Zn-dependent protease
MRSKAAQWWLGGTTWLLACAGAAAIAVIPYTSGEVAKPMSEDEQRVWSQARELDEIILKGGVTYDDEVLRQYVQGVMDRLYPDFKGHIRVTLLKAPHLNAFAVPDGNIYVNIGLLARFQNEAQLATVLAHEGTHFTHRHGYRNQQSLKDNTAFATYGSMLGLPGLLPQLIAISSVFGYSRELETEADVNGYQRLAQGGYDVREAPKAFDHLMREVKAEDIKEPFFFATHPKLKDRFDNLTKLSSKAAGGGDGASRADYARVMQKARTDNLENQLSMGRVKSSLIVLEDPEHMQELPPYAPYFLGEAYRLRGDKGDLERAEAAYVKAIEAAPDYAPSYRALGILCMKKTRYHDATRYLGKYLELNPAAVDRKYVESYLRMIEKKGGNP